MKAPKYVIAPEGCADGLTPNKKYLVRDFRVDDTYGGSFHITDDHGFSRFCLLKECATLNDGNWIIPDDESDGESNVRPVVTRVAVGDVWVAVDDEDDKIVCLTDGDVGFLSVKRAHIPALIDALKMMEKN